MANTRVTNPVTGFNSATEEGLKLPSGTNANQPSGVQGMIRNDTGETTGSSASAIEHHNGTNWQYFAATESPDNPFLASQNFNTVLYPGTGVSNPITGVGFQPDLIWVKRRTTSTANHYIVDTVRGNGTSTYKNLSSDTTNVEGTTTSSGITNSTIVDGGFTMQGTGARTNASGSTYVAWCFKAGGAAVANTDGSIPSQVSANVAGGFSIVSWSGNSVSPSTVGHGLGVAPELFIIKNLSSAVNWSVYSSSVGVGFKLLLNEINQASATSNYANTSPTSSVFSLSGGNEVNGSGSNYIAYCFHSVAGYSKVGSFVGTGAAGKKITLDFQPAWLMIKRTSTTGNWTIVDDKRTPLNKYLSANSNAAETSASNPIVFESDGFSFTGGSFNQSGQTAMYLAFA